MKIPFTDITSEGGLLPTDFLQELLDPKTTIEGTTPVAYHLAEGERIGDQVNRSWNRLLGCWQNFKKSIANKLPNDSTTTETRERWLSPLFQELGFGRLTTTRALEIDGRSYPISHTWNHVLIHLVGSHLDIDRRTPGATGAAKASPHSLVQQALNASDEHVWGIVSNGLTLRLLRDNIALTRMAYVEWDLQAIVDGNLYSEFFLLWLVCHESRFEGDRPDQCWLEKWKKAAEDKGFRALENLRPGVQKAINALGEGLVSNQANEKLREKLRTGDLSTQHLYEQVLRIVYRLLFLFVAEDRGLLHPPVTKSDKETESESLKARDRYDKFYSISRLRGMTLYRAGTPHPDLWNSFRLICLKLGSDAGAPELALPALGSFLWDTVRSTPDLNDCLISNRQFLTAIQSLAFVQDGSVRRNVDYRNLGSEELGSVYESLLELHPVVNVDSGAFELGAEAGSERKTTGSYYTPDSLVQCLLDSALEPVMAGAVRGKEGTDAVEALLSLRVCDPAVGSGHFLIAAAHRIAKRVAAVRTGEGEPGPEPIRTALRDVIARCLYGVDVNPMAAELCKVSFWLESLEPGKPLSFLDHHIRVGNSLLGATAELIGAGIPDNAFTPIEGDDKKACAALKKLNARQRRGFGDLFVREDASNLEGLRQAALAVDELADDTPEAVHLKETAFAEAQRNYTYLRAQHLADAWCAAFVIQKRFKPGTTDPIGITQSHLRKLAQGDDISDELNSEIHHLAHQHQFFHWYLEFPDIFVQSTVRQQPIGGFDVVLGNPPWEKVELLQREWFATIRPDLTSTPAGKEKSALLKELSDFDPSLYERFVQAVREVDGGRTLIQHSGRYPLCGQGRINSYAAFAETNLHLLGLGGVAGCVLPPGIATDDSTKFFIQHLVENELISCFFVFTNRGYIFPGIESTLSFALVTYGKQKVPSLQLAAQLWQVEHLKDSGRVYSLDKDTIRQINPNTLNLPILQSSRDAFLVSDVHRRIPVLKLENGKSAFGQIDFKQGLFNMTTDKKIFDTLERLEDGGFSLTGNRFTLAEDIRLPLYEAKFTSQFNHRHGTFENVPQSERFGTRAQTSKPTIEDLSDPYWCVLPRYWVTKEVVCDAMPEDWNRCWFLGFRNAISAVADSRSVAFAIVPLAAVGNSLPLLFCFDEPINSALLLANFNSFVLDYVARQKASGGNLNFYVVKQLPILAVDAYETACPWDSTPTALKEWLLPRTLELSYTAWDLDKFAEDCGRLGPPFSWDEERRILLRCELDAAFFHLYLGDEDEWKEQSGPLTTAFPTPRHAIAYIMDTFPIVKRKDEEKYGGDYRTKRIVLEIYDAMSQAMRSGKAYQTRLNPLPASFRQAHLPRLPQSERPKFSDPEVYLAQFILSIVRQGPDETDLDLLQDALALLIHRETHRAEIGAVLGDDTWFKTFNAPLDPNVFRSLLERFVAGKVLYAFKEDVRLRLTLQNDPDQDIDSWIAFDTSVALAVIARRPDIQEVLVDTLPASFRDNLQNMAVA